MTIRQVARPVAKPSPRGAVNGRPPPAVAPERTGKRSDGLNKVMLLGNLGADPELRATQGGQSVLKLRLATSESFLDKQNERQERTEWHQVTIWGKRGEALAKFLAKGNKLFVEGRIQTSTYEKDGEKKYRTEVIANNVILLGGKPGGARLQDEGEIDQGDLPF